MSKKKEQPKIADPVEQEPHAIPEYKRPFNELKKTVRVGDMVNLTVRGYDKELQETCLEETSGEVVDVYEKGFRWKDEETKKVRSKPWWGVHDWEILETGD